MTSTHSPILVEKNQDKALPVVILAGATASGKSALALEIAQAVGAVIINADSIQVYKQLPTLTAFPSQEECLKVPHLLYGQLSLEVKATAVWWRDQVMTLLGRCYEERQVPIIVGGTGFYIRTLLHGISQIPSVDPVVFDQGRNRLASEGSQDLWRALKEVDPISASRIEPMDSHRVLRAWTVWCSSGQPLSSWQTQATGGMNSDPRFEGINVFLNPSRPLLKDRITQRLEQMEMRGVKEEVDHFLNVHQGVITPLHKAVGVEEIGGFLRKKWSYEEAKVRMNYKTCQLAKRQVTWFKHQYDHSILLSEPDYEKSRHHLSPLLRQLKKVSR